MSRRTRFPRRAFVSSATACALILGGCAKGKEATDSASVSKDGAPPRAALVGPKSPGSPMLPGALQRPLDQYTADQFYAFASSLTFGGGVNQPRRCRGNPACDPGGGRQTSARVDAVDGQDSLSASPTTSNGVVAVRARNTGAYEEARYGMRPGPFEYYIVVFPAASGNGTWRMQQVDTTAGAHTMTQVASGTFQPCGHKFQRNRPIRASFYTCANSPDAVTTEKLGLAQGGGGFGDPIWVSCSAGCCIVTQ